MKILSPANMARSSSMFSFLMVKMMSPMAPKRLSFFCENLCVNYKIHSTQIPHSIFSSC